MLSVRVIPMMIPSGEKQLIDGNISDWNLSETYFDVLRLAGRSDKPVTAKLYMMFNYTTRTMSILVINEPGYRTFPKPWFLVRRRL